MATPPTDPLALLASLPSPPFLVRLTALPATPARPGEPATWRLELSEDDGTSWSSFEPGRPGHATPGAAIEAGAQAIELWKSSRIDAQQTEVSHFFLSGRLERRKIQVLSEDNTTLVTVDGYAAQAEDGSWLEDAQAITAINKAKSKPVKLRDLKKGNL